MRILLVDDDPGFRALLRTTFEVVDVEVREAENVAAAEAAIGTESEIRKAILAGMDPQQAYLRYGKF